MLSFFVQNDKRTNKPKVWVYKDKATHEPKGEATVTYDDPPTAEAAIKWFDGKISFQDIDSGMRNFKHHRRENIMETGMRPFRHLPYGFSGQDQNPGFAQFALVLMNFTQFCFSIFGFTCISNFLDIKIPSISCLLIDLARKSLSSLGFSCVISLQYLQHFDCT